MPPSAISRPEPAEYHEAYRKYMQRVPGDDLLAAAGEETAAALSFLLRIPEERTLFRYEPGKWSVREVLAHVADTERIMAYRLLRFARNDVTPLPGFDQNDYIRSARFDEIPWSALIEDFECVRRASLSLFRNLPAEAWMRRGAAGGREIGVRALGYMLLGHQLHHFAILRERYLA